MPVWPSDPPVKLTPQSHVSRDGSHTVRLSSIELGSHTGTHMDAPYHFIEGGKTLDEMPLDTFVGPAVVMEFLGVSSIQRSDLEAHSWAGVERVLFKTDNSNHWSDDQFFEQFVYLDPAAAEFLAEQGLRLVGIDYLSIDQFRSLKHPSHFILLGKHIAILEGLNLNNVRPGLYQLVALPLRLQNADGAPTRAILID